MAHLVYQKTVGNPFFAIQFVSALVEEGLLTFDHGAGRWALGAGLGTSIEFAPKVTPIMWWSSWWAS